jgi:hypothetical protein
MMCEKMMLQCGHKLRMKVYKRANIDGLCPLYECRCPLTLNEKEKLEQQVILWETPLWELHQFGRPATQEERIEREKLLAKLPKPMGSCQGVTLTGKNCRCLAMRSNGKFCSRHLNQAV